MTNTQIPKVADRHLVLIDIEDLADTASPACEEVEMIKVALAEVLPDFDDAHRIVACGHHAAPTVAFAFPRARHLWRSAPAGAGLALLDVLENEHVDQRFGRVTICSGRAIFASGAARLAGANVNVTAVALEGRLSAPLQLAARYVVQLRRSTILVATGT
jgi:hypothetical protein